MQVITGLGDGMCGSARLRRLWQRRPCPAKREVALADAVKPRPRRGQAIRRTLHPKYVYKMQRRRLAVNGIFKPSVGRTMAARHRGYGSLWAARCPGRAGPQAQSRRKTKGKGQLSMPHVSAPGRDDAFRPRLYISGHWGRWCVTRWAGSAGRSPWRTSPNRRRRSAIADHPGGRECRIRHHPSVRLDRMLRSGHRLPAAARVGGTGAGGQGALHGASWRQPDHAGVEGVLYAHSAVLEVAVVAKPDARWGETPCVFVTLRSRPPPRTSSPTVGPIRPATRRRAAWCSATCPRSTPARSRRTRCGARWSEPGRSPQRATA